MGLSLLLVCAVLASLTAGVLVAYGICVAMFWVFRIHSQRAAETRRQIAIRQAVQG